jgi:hypothetical protein
MTRVLILLTVAACSNVSTGDDNDYCPDASCILHLCECGSDSCADAEPQLCGSDSECGSGEQCTFEFDDTQQCSMTCNDDGTGCPSGYTCQTFIP